MKVTIVRWALLAVFALASAACASGGGSSGQEGTATSSRYVITEDDLLGMDQLNVYEAVRRLRPTWLRYRGQAVLESPQREGLRIYLDGSFFGDAEAMATLQVPDVQEVRFLDARQATLRYGTGHTVGAILITTRR